jgi:hypothetical protein
MPICLVSPQTILEIQFHFFRTIASSEQEAASTLVLIVETVSRCLLSLTQAFGIKMRLAQAFLVVLIALLGCKSANPPERRWISLSMPPYTEVVCELRAYRIGDRTYAKAEFETLKEGSDRDLRWEVSGFLWEIVSPERFAGKALSSHFDGPLASGDPFESFAFGKRYVMKVSERFIGDDRFPLCY